MHRATPMLAMHVSALKPKVENLPMVLAADALAWDGPLATFHTTWTVNPRHISRAEIAGLVLLSLVLHGVVAVRLARPGAAEPVVHEQQVNIEILRPPPAVKPVSPPPAPPPEKPAPVPRKAAAEPRVVARLEPVARPSHAPATPNEVPALPVGDDPALAAPSGTGTARPEAQANIVGQAIQPAKRKGDSCTGSFLPFWRLADCSRRRRHR